MPRIYYNQEDRDIQTVFFVFHSLVYLLVNSLLWINAGQNAALIILIWTSLLAYHNYWRTSLEEGMQQRTYDRLRNRFGIDWDLVASPQEFEHEREKTVLEFKLKHVLPDTTQALLAAAGIGFVLLFQLGAVSVSFLGNVGLGWLLTVSILQARLRLRLRQQSLAYEAFKKKQSERISERLTDANQQPRAGMMLVIGDDGELLEVPKHKQL